MYRKANPSRPGTACFPATRRRVFTVIVKRLIGIEIDVEALPMGDEEAVSAGVETVIFASEVMGRNGRRVVDKQFDLVDGLRVKREKEDYDIIVTKDEPED
jgi:hypothetical protein